MIRTIYLHGALAEQFGKEPIELDVDTPQMVFRGLSSRFKGFDAALRSNEKVSIIKTDPEGKPAPVTAEALGMTLGNAPALHITPAVEGAGAEIAAAIAAEVAAEGTLWYYVVYAVVIVVEIYAMSAISQRLAPSPDLKGSDRGSTDQRPSFLFNGPVNVTAPGYPVPLVYGTFRPGSVVISTGVQSEQI